MKKGALKAGRDPAVPTARADEAQVADTITTMTIAVRPGPAVVRARIGSAMNTDVSKARASQAAAELPATVTKTMTITVRQAPDSTGARIGSAMNTGVL